MSLMDISLCFAEIGALSARLKERGIVETKVGIEFEFSLPERPEDGSVKWEELRREILAELDGKLRLLPKAARAALAAKREEVAAFNAREILMYDLIERDARTKGILEPLFGRNENGRGYYDGENVLELKVKAAEAQEALANQEILLRALREKAAALGLPFKMEPFAHVNFSFWTAEGNVFEGGAQEKAVTEGLAKGFYECLPLIIDSKNVGAETGHTAFDLGFSRDSFLRRAGNRVEARVSSQPQDQDIPAIVAVGMASALYGLSRGDAAAAGMIRAQPEKNPSVHFDEDKYMVLSHLVSNSVVDGQGFLCVPQRYFERSAYDVAYALGLEKEPPQGIFQAFGGLPRFFEGMQDFFDRTRIEASGEGCRIVWPETEEGHFKISVPPVNMDKIPEELRQRLMNGEDPENMRREIGEHLPPGEFLPQPGHAFRIDLALLERNVQCKGVAERYTVSPGYDLDDRKGFDGMSLGDVRRARFRNSAVLGETTSPAFREELMRGLKGPQKTVVTSRRKNPRSPRV
jgi:hypothetical protein